MFEKHDIESELFLASIKVKYPQSNKLYNRLY